MAAVLLLTHRPSFASAWSAALQRSQRPARTVTPLEAASVLAPGVALIVDTGSLDFSDAELLSCLALARGRGGIPAVVLSAERMAPIEDALIELCGGLFARSDNERDRIIAAVVRRSDPRRAERFVHLGNGLLRDELTAIFDDGTAAVCPRPLCERDSGAAIASIALSEDLRSAQLLLEDGSGFELVASELLQTSGPSAAAGAANGVGALGDVDGVRLGQRLRALRIAAGLTQAELARRTGIHRPNIARVEAGRHTPSLETLARLATAIGVSTTRVLSD